MNPFLEILYQEHDIITSAIERVQRANVLIGINDEQYEKTIRELLGFFRSYADSFHHHKEEIILFPEMNKKNELLKDGLIKEMFENHEDFRDMLRHSEELLNKKNFAEAQKALEQYCDRLLEHIAVENEEVFQIAETLFTEKELEEIYFRFIDTDRELGIELKNELAKAIESTQV